MLTSSPLPTGLAGIGSTFSKPCLGHSPLPKSPLGELGKAALEVFHSLSPASLSSGASPLPGSWYWQHQGRGPSGCPLTAGWAKTCYPGGNHSPLPPSLIPSWICPFLSIPSHTPTPHLLTTHYFPTFILLFQEKNPKFKAAKAGSPPPDPLACVVTVSVGRITRKGIENCEGVQGRGKPCSREEETQCLSLSLSPSPTLCKGLSRGGSDTQLRGHLE